jgi:hypothetical protein
MSWYNVKVFLNKFIVFTYIVRYKTYAWNQFNTLVDCEWNEWKIGECSQTCGGGERTNTRDKKIREAHGGKECSGSSTITETCNVNDCPGKLSSLK